jgi:hypothetical protein
MEFESAHPQILEVGTQKALAPREGILNFRQVAGAQSLSLSEPSLIWGKRVSR